MNIIDRLNSGELHAKARAERPECVDAKGNIHCSKDRAAFVDWRDAMTAKYGRDVNEWPSGAREEFALRFVPSH